MNTERLVENNALPFAAAMLAEDHRGFECVVVVARLAWEVSAEGHVRIALPQRPIRIDPQYRDGADSSLRYASDKVCNKEGTELLMLAKAWPDPGAASQHIDVSLRVTTGMRTLHKAVRVFGPRSYVKTIRGVAPGPAGPITEPVAITYELAEGGTLPATARDEMLMDPINPVGRGIAREKRHLIGSEAPQVEPIEGNKPAGFGPIARHWSPRKELYGTTDEQWQRIRYPIPPVDFDVRYNCDGHPDLWSEEPMRGDEPVEIIGATPEGKWSFRLPYYWPRFDVVMSNGEEEHLDTKLDSMLIDIENPKERIVELTWRASVRLPKKSELIDKIRVTNAVDVSRSHYDDLIAREHDSEGHTELS